MNDENRINEQTNRNGDKNNTIQQQISKRVLRKNRRESEIRKQQQHQHSHTDK